MDWLGLLRNKTAIRCFKLTAKHTLMDGKQLTYQGISRLKHLFQELRGRGVYFEVLIKTKLLLNTTVDYLSKIKQKKDNNLLAHVKVFDQSR